MEKENIEEEEGKWYFHGGGTSQSGEPPDWDDDDRELNEQFPREFPIIRKFLDELVVRKRREQQRRIVFHHFCTLTRRYYELEPDDNEPLRALNERLSMLSLHSFPPRNPSFVIYLEAFVQSIFPAETALKRWLHDFLKFVVDLISKTNHCFSEQYYFFYQEQKQDYGDVEQEWLYTFHQFRSLRRSKDLDEVKTDPIEKQWLDEFCKFRSSYERPDLREAEYIHSERRFLLLINHFFTSKFNEVVRKHDPSANEWFDDLDEFCILDGGEDFGEFAIRSKEKKQEWLDEFHHLLALFPEKHEVDWNQIEQLARAGPVFGNMELAISRVDGIHAFLETEKSTCNHSRSSQAFYCQVHNVHDASSTALSTSTLHASLVFSNNVSDRATEIFNVFLQQNSPNDLQTLLLFGEYNHLIHQIPRKLFIHLSHLNVLDLSWTSITELPSSFANLRSLRYLDVSGTPITRLPNCICSFQDMQTLRLKQCSQLLSLPKDLSRLTKLRHLDLDVSSQLSSMPPGMGSLTELRTLPVFIVGKNEGCNIDELTELMKLQGSLSILRLENVSDALLRKNFGPKKSFIENIRLEKLELEWTAASAHDGFNVLDFLQPHVNIKELRILGYKGRSLAVSWIGNPAFLNLKTVKLSSFRCPGVPRFDLLPQLQVLHMSDFHNIKKIFYKSVPGSVLFPRLNTLVLHSFPDLKDWVGIEYGDFPMLADLKVSYCPKLSSLPQLGLLSSLKDMEISLCPQLQQLPITPEVRPPPLQSLRIIDCPILKRQCNTEAMKSYLSYIPDLVIEGE